MSFWEKVKKDIQGGVREGIGIVREGAIAVKEKAEELTEEGKRKYKIYDLKTKVQKWIADLGGRVFELSSKDKNPMLDVDVKLIIARIKKLEAQITKLEGKPEGITKKTSAKRTVKNK